MKNRLHFILIFCLIVVAACGNNPEEEAVIAIDEALSLMGEDKCDEAIKLLAAVKDQSDNPVYLKTYASAYACKAGFNMIKFVDDDIGSINDNNLLPSISTLSYSDETSVDSESYTAMKRALSILGRSDFKQATRTSKFGKRHGEDMGVQVLVYSLMQFGKYLNWYGNVNATGKKGAGTNTNSCYLNYTYAPAAGIIAGLPASNACQTVNDGHPDLAGANRVRRVCEGLTLITNIIDTLNNIDLSSSTSLSSLEDIVAELSTYRTAADAAGVGYLLDVTSPSACETLLANASDMNNAELLFALVLDQEHE